MSGPVPGLSGLRCPSLGKLVVMANEPADDILLTAKDVKVLLRTHAQLEVSDKTLARWRKAGRLPFVRVGPISIRYPLAGVRRLFAANTGGDR